VKFWTRNRVDTGCYEAVVSIGMRSHPGELNWISAGYITPTDELFEFKRRMGIEMHSKKQTNKIAFWVGLLGSLLSEFGCFQLLT